jgi:hypothetical protein
MGMIPTCPIEVGDKGIGEAPSRRNRALLNPWNTIHPSTNAMSTNTYLPLGQNNSLGLFLQNAMPMKCHSLFGCGDLVMNCYLNGISPRKYQYEA